MNEPKRRLTAEERRELDQAKADQLYTMERDQAWDDMAPEMGSADYD